MTSAARTPGPVTADDVTEAVRLSLAALRGVPDSRWDLPAGDLAWTCWETAEHLADDLFAYALQLGPRTPSVAEVVPVSFRRERPDAPANTIFVGRDKGGAGLLQVLEACGALLAAMVRVTPPEVRSHHGFGASDPEGFGAMGVVETLVHTYDLVAGLGLPPLDPPAGLCARTLHRLFPDAPADAEPWPALLWCTGRIELPGRPRLARWRWYGEPRG
jgi:mycothiol maleylpyruvate isomerase-like protein